MAKQAPETDSQGTPYSTRPNAISDMAVNLLLVSLVVKGIIHSKIQIIS